MLYMMNQGRQLLYTVHAHLQARSFTPRGCEELRQGTSVIGSLLVAVRYSSWLGDICNWHIRVCQLGALLDNLLGYLLKHLHRMHCVLRCMQDLCSRF